MKCTIPEISWHNREPVLSVDINPISNETYRLATSGGDSHVLIWQLSLSENGAVKQELVSDLTRHQRAVNVVRWSPSGQYLASADDDANIIIWQQKTDNIPLLEGDNGDKEIWIVYKILRGHKEDIYDLCWSVDGLQLLSGSIDNTAILWDLTKGKLIHILSDHKGFVQGVAWDPKDQLLATISTDRICRIFSTDRKHVKARIYKGRLPVPSEHYLDKKEVKYFHDDTFKSFFRRLQFSPDGSLLIVPSGYIETDDCKKTLNATLVFTLDHLSEPAAVLPSQKQCSTAVRFCPVLFELHEEGPDPIVKLPYRMVFAISTDHDVILYDTQQSVPFARFQEIHYTRLTDLTWSSDGRLLIASSTDGFCALITFEAEELGVPYVKEDSETEENPMDISGFEELEKDEPIVANNKETDIDKVNEKKRPSFIEQWALKTPKKIKLDSEKKAAMNNVIEIVDDEDDVQELSSEIREEINKLIPRRATTKTDNNKVQDDKTVAKPIAVRRKPKTEETAREEITPLVFTHKHKFGETAKEGAKPIEVRKKPRNVAHYKENQPSNNRISETSPQKPPNEKPVEEAMNGKAVQCDEIIEIEDSEPTTENRAEKKDTTKIKVTSLTKKKPRPQKTNPLLKFLKSSEKNKKSSKRDIPSCIDLTLSQEEARDAWKCEKDVKESSSHSSDSSNAQPMEEDCTEDFCLQLEDSQEPEKDSKKKQGVIESTKPSTSVDFPLEGNDSGGSVTSNKASDAKSTTEQKVPRKVALITLASPKGKKKQKS